MIITTNDNAYNDGLHAGRCVAHAVSHGWQSIPQDGDWSAAIERWAGDFGAGGHLWRMGFCSALIGSGAIRRADEVSRVR